jgi:hypothetical protein
MDQFEGWTKLLALAQAHKTKAALREAIGTSGLVINETVPLSGYYRSAAVKNGPMLPVAIWRDESGKLNILRAGQPVALERVWPYAVWHPVSYDDYEAVTERGERWKDEPATSVSAEVITESVALVHMQIGGNNPPEEDDIAKLKREIEAARGVAEQDYKEITTDDQAAAAQSLRSRLNELSGTADKKREAEKRPHFEAAKAVDAKWQPIVKLGKEAADWLRGKLSDYATRKANEEAAAQRIALAEEARLAAERAAAQPEDGESEQGAPPVEQQSPPPAPTSATIKGATGRAATIRVVKVAKVVDYDKAYAHLKAIPEIKKVIDQVAQRFITAGNEVPGVEVHERRDVA